MNRLIEFFNEKYGDKYGKISYPRTTLQIYRVYQSIKSYGINDEELVKLLHDIKLPKPKTIEEKELYADCLYNKDDSEIKIDTSNLVSKESPVFTGSISMGRKEGTSIGENSYAIGYNVEASGDSSHAEGYMTNASGTNSHAEGYKTNASGSISHAEGYNTTSSGNYSHAEGTDTTASGYNSHAEGHGTTAHGENQHVEGRYNIVDNISKYAHIVGNGNSDNKSNAHTLDWKGNAWFAGDVKGTNLPYNISSKVLATVPASNIKLDNEIPVNNVSINKDKRYYIEFLGIEKLCSLSLDDIEGNAIICSINNYKIEVYNDSTNITISINKIDKKINDDTFTDLIIHEEENKYLDSKYLESDLILQNSISMGRVGNLGVGSSAVGYNVEASDACSHAEGYATTASGRFSHAEGDGTIASGECSHAEGSETTALGECSHAEGDNTTAVGDCSHAEGSGTQASGNCSHAEGGGTVASGSKSHAEGTSTAAPGDSSHSEGKYTGAPGNCSHAEGYNTKASSDYQHVQGKFNIEDTENKYAHIVGNGSSKNNRSNAHTLDWEGNGWYAGDVRANNIPYVANEKVVLTVPAASITAKKTEIDDNSRETPVQIPVNGTVTYDSTKSYYLKYNNIQYPVSNFMETFGTVDDNCCCTIMSQNDSTVLIISILDTTNITDMQLIEKDVKKLDDVYIPNDLRVNNSITVGVRSGEIGGFSSSFGLNCEASGNCSYAEGSYTTASADYAHAEGNDTTASGINSHAEGCRANASGDYSHAEGGNTIASGFNSHVEGRRTIASGDYSHVQGKFNIEDAANKYAHIVGNGEDSDNRANAHTLDWKGNAWYAGKLSQEGTPTEDKDLITKKYFDDGISSLPQISFNENGELVVTINGVSKIFVPKS